jgi:hypothetical protein
VAAVIVTAALAGCAPAPVNPELTSAAADARSATQTVRLGVAQDRDARLLPTTASVVYEDMMAELTDAASRLAQQVADTSADTQYRKAALEATRLAIEGTHQASRGDTAGAQAELRRALRVFDRMGVQ